MKLIFCMLIEIQTYVNAILGSIDATFPWSVVVVKLCHSNNLLHMSIKVCYKLLFLFENEFDD